MEDDLELVSAHTNLAILTGDGVKRTEIFQQATEIRERRLGQAHPLSIETRVSYAAYHPSPKEGIEILRPACDRYARSHPKRGSNRFHCVLRLSFLLAEVGDLAGAAQALSKVDTFRIDDESPVLLRLSKGYGFLYTGDHESALSEFRAVNEFLSTGSNKTSDYLDAQATLGRGISEHALGRSRAAIATVDRAIAWLDKAVQTTANPAYPRLLARARVAVAEALWSVGQDGQAADGPEMRARACQEIDRAASWYRGAGPDYAWRVKALGSWQARCPPPPVEGSQTAR